MRTNVQKIVIHMSKFGIYVLIALQSLSWAMAEDSHAQRKKLNEITVRLELQGEQLELLQLFKELERATTFDFAYSKEELKGKTVNLNQQIWSLNDLLREISIQSQVSFKRVNEQIGVAIATSSDPLPQIEDEIVVAARITGVILDESDLGLPGATVMEKGTTNGTITNLDGRFELEVSDANATLQISFIGYETVEFPLNGRTVVQVNLSPDFTSLEEVVVVGYGTQQRESVTGSVSSIGGKELMEVPSGNISESLQGRLPGISIAATSSQPGAAMQLRIRGVRSLTASNDPLIVLDGIPFPGAISDINPNDVKSIDILKDASATAIYGSRGANGVVLITTNKGKKGQKASISYNSFIGVKKLFSKYPMMEGDKFYQLRSDAGLYTESGAGTTPTLGTDEAQGVNTDWQDLFYNESAMTTSHDVGISGGTESGNYNFGIAYFHDESLIPTQQFDRYSMRGSVDQNVGKFIKVGFTTNNAYSLQQGSQVGVGGVLGLTPIANPYNEDGSLKRNISQVLDDSYVLTNGVIKELGDRWVSETRAFASYNSLYGELSIPWVEGLKIRSNLGLNYRQTNGGGFTGRGVNNVNEDQLSSASVSNSHTYNWTNENMLIYDNSFGNHHVNFTGLISASQNTYNRSRMTARDIPQEDFQFYNLGAAAGEIQIAPDDQWYNVSGLQSYMARVQYEYNDLYMLTATIRSDGSSRLADANKWHTYPAISVGWNLGNEAFLSSVSKIDRLKLRLGYGETSNQSVNPYSTLGSLATRPYNHGDDNYVTGFYVNTIPNPALGWEYSQTTNFGVDFGLFKGRLSGTVDYYVTNTKDLLLQIGLPSTSGVSSVTSNVGETQNKGIELTLNGVILENANGWSVEAGMNFYANKNQVVSLASGQQRDESNWWFVGHPINVIYDYEYDGIWQESDDHVDLYEPGGSGAGMIKVKYNGGFNEDGTPERQIGPDDRQIIQVDPKWQGGFNTRVAYKDLDLTIVGFYQNGGTLISTLYGGSGYLNLLSGRRNNVDVDYWTPDNTGAKYPDPSGFRSGDNLKYMNTLAYFDHSFMKIRTITLGYNMEGLDFIKKAGISKMRFYVTAQNPFVMFSPYHKETGLDPETNSYGDQNQAVNQTYRPRLLVQGTNTPQTRNFLFGLNLTF